MDGFGSAIAEAAGRAAIRVVAVAVLVGAAIGGLVVYAYR